MKVKNVVQLSDLHASNVVDLCIGNKSDENESNSNESNENKSNANELSNVNDSNESEISNLDESCGNGDSALCQRGWFGRNSYGGGFRSSEARPLHVSMWSLSRRRLVLGAPRKLQCPLLGGESLPLLEAAESVVALLQSGARTLVRAGSSGSVLALRGLLWNGQSYVSVSLEVVPLSHHGY